MHTVYLVLVAYFVFLTTLHWLKKSDFTLFSSLRLSPKTHWFPAGVVLFVTLYSTSSAGLVSAIVTEKGPGDLLILWSSLIPLGFLPLVFAPLWAKLDFISENEMLTLRYAAPWSERLLRFRGVYVGLLIVPILLSFLLLTFADVLIAFLNIEKPVAIALLTGAMMLNAFRVSYRQKSLLDLVHFAAFMLPLLVVAFRVGSNPDLQTLSFDEEALLPDAWSLVAFLGVQWWSAQIIDAGGVEAQQLMGNGRRKAAKTALVMSLLTVAVASLVFYVALHAGGHIQPGQQAYLHVVRFALPEVLFPIMAIGLFGMFLSTFEALQLWGSGLVLSGLNKGMDQSSSVRRSRQLMVLSALLTGLIAWQADRLTVLLELLLGLTAGVGLVYILRWFWWRINAQTQLVAMLWPIILMGLHKLLPALFSSFEWMLELSYPKTLLLYTSLSLPLMAITMWNTNNEADRVAFTRFSHVVDLKSFNPVRKVLLALIFGMALLTLQIGIVWWILHE
ncbi:MAG: hypothetical protein P8N19_12970 [Flavobacteriales bacterium]|nr:hypothetical protein [Flavobacteriales bacterium]